MSFSFVKANGITDQRDHRHRRTRPYEVYEPTITHGILAATLIDPHMHQNTSELLHKRRHKLQDCGRAYYNEVDDGVETSGATKKLRH